MVTCVLYVHVALGRWMSRLWFCGCRRLMGHVSLLGCMWTEHHAYSSPPGAWSCPQARGGGGVGGEILMVKLGWVASHVRAGPCSVLRMKSPMFC